MRIVWLFCLALAVLSCDSSFSGRREVTALLSGLHPWESASHTRFSWSWTSSSGEKGTMDGKARSCSLSFPLGECGVVVAYPLGDYEPYGAVVPPDAQEVELTPEGGRVAQVLLRLWPDYGKQLRHLDWPKLEAYLDGRVWEADLPSLLVSVLNGKLPDTLPLLPNVGHTFVSLPEGRWIGERFELGSFWHRSNSKERFSLPDGCSVWYCPEKQVAVKVVVDARTARVWQALHKQERWW